MARVSAGGPRGARHERRRRRRDRRRRPVRPDARRRAARRGRRRAAALDHLVRSAHRSRVPLAGRHDRPRSGCSSSPSNPALTNFTLTKLLWVRTHEPDIWSRVRHVLLPKDYVRFRLSGEHAIDVADASGTLMLDVARRALVAARCSTPRRSTRGLLPAVFESPAICARVSTRAAGAHRPLRGHADRRRRRRSGGGRDRHGHHAAGRRQRDDRHLRRRVCRDRSAGDRSRRAAFTRSATRFPGAGT